jgi:hypothetical protein
MTKRAKADRDAVELIKTLRRPMLPHFAFGLGAR